MSWQSSPGHRRGSRASAGSPALDEPATLAPDTIARAPVIRHDAMHGGSASLRHLPHEPAAGRSRASGAAGLLSQPRRPRPRHLPPERLGAEPRPVARAWAPDPVACGAQPLLFVPEWTDAARSPKSGSALTRIASSAWLH